MLPSESIIRVSEIRVGEVRNQAPRGMRIAQPHANSRSRPQASATRPSSAAFASAACFGSTRTV